MVRGGVRPHTRRQLAQQPPGRSGGLGATPYSFRPVILAVQAKVLKMRGPLGLPGPPLWCLGPCLGDYWCQANSEYKVCAVIPVLRLSDPILDN